MVVHLHCALPPMQKGEMALLPIVKIGTEIIGYEKLGFVQLRGGEKLPISTWFLFGLEDHFI